MLAILIPTFNRKKELKKNILYLLNQIEINSLSDQIILEISNNNSTDGTYEFLNELENEYGKLVKVFHQNTNIGLERNCLFLMENCSASHIMFLGDDDTLAPGYLNFVLKEISTRRIGAIVPGNIQIFEDCKVIPARKVTKTVYYKPGYLSVLALSHYGHQLSGLVLRNDDSTKNYQQHPEYKNIYPFIYFLIHNALRYTTIYAPGFLVQIYQSAEKDWNYNKVNLLNEIFKNFDLQFGKNTFKSILCQISFVDKQSWRLGFAKNYLFLLQSYYNIMSSRDISFTFKILVHLVYVFTLVKRLIKKI